MDVIDIRKLLFCWTFDDEGPSEWDEPDLEPDPWGRSFSIEACFRALFDSREATLAFNAWYFGDVANLQSLIAIPYEAYRIGAVRAAFNTVLGTRKVKKPGPGLKHAPHECVRHAILITCSSAS